MLKPSEDPDLEWYSLEGWERRTSKVLQSLVLVLKKEN